MENENKDEKLWQLASQRARFKGKVISYLGVNAFLWALWFLTCRNNEYMHDTLIPWPAWVSIGWGFGLIMRYIRIYHSNSDTQIQKEYDKLKNKS